MPDAPVAHPRGDAADFPSLAWMQQYADLVGAHPRSDQIAWDLEGRYRFVITPGGGFREERGFDFVVTRDGFDAHEAGTDPAIMVVTADYPRWKKLLTGQSDFMMSFLMRKIRIDGDLGQIKGLLNDVKPLLDCLSRVQTTFPYAT